MFPTLSDSSDWDLAIPVDRYRKYNSDYWNDVKDVVKCIISNTPSNLTDKHHYSDSISRASIYA